METPKAKFGFGQTDKHAPKWLVPAFAIAIIVIGAVTFMINGDPALSDVFKLRANNYLMGLAMIVSGIAPLFGVDLKKK